MSKLIVKNKRGYFEYEILKKEVAGIQLVGSEVKSIKSGNVSISEAYCYINNDEIFIKGMHVAEHKEAGTKLNHEPIRNRKLLLKKKEIIGLRENVSVKGFTIIPLSIILSDTGYIKLEIGLGKGKNLYDKSKAIKLRDLDRDLKRNV
jgi:SsrA-binding protein